MHYICSISDLISDGDLKSLADNLDELANEAGDEKWDHVIEKSKASLFYNAKCCKPKDGPLKYLSVTVFEDCSPETLRDFYMDCDYRTQWDKTVVAHEQLQIDQGSGIEIGRTIKKFPLLTPREYVLAWKVWEGSNRTFYCFTKVSTESYSLPNADDLYQECEHPLAPVQKKFVRVAFFRSGWRIRPVCIVLVPGRNACEIKMVHQEDAGLNAEFAKLAFARGIWSYVCKMDDALRKYSSPHRSQSSSNMTAVSLIQKVPRELDAIVREETSNLVTGSSNDIYRLGDDGANSRKIKRTPSKKMIANGLLLLGGLICLTQGNSGLGAKVAVAFVLKKLSKRGSSCNHNQRNK
ncbi:Phosphatidylcholine transfer protein [Bienertia sinuspersici]